MPRAVISSVEVFVTFVVYCFSALDPVHSCLLSICFSRSLQTLAHAEWVCDLERIEYRVRSEIIDTTPIVVGTSGALMKQQLKSLYQLGNKPFGALLTDESSMRETGEEISKTMNLCQQEIVQQDAKQFSLVILRKKALTSAPTSLSGQVPISCDIHHLARVSSKRCYLCSNGVMQMIWLRMWFSSMRVGQVIVSV